MSALYKRVFAYGSLQFCGHIEEYLAAHTAELLLFIVQPRVGATTNLFRRYRGGALLEERSLRSSQNVILYYLLWFVNHVRLVLSFCPRNERTIIFGGHPVAFFGMGFLKRLRPLAFAYWIGDHYPSPVLSVRLFERVKRWYHDRVDFAFYLTDAINRVMNGEVTSTPARRTVMWGLKPFPVFSVPPMTPFSVLFVGLIRPGQGLEALFDYLAAHRDCRLSVIGVCQPEYAVRLEELLGRLELRSRVFFPNRFYSEAELLEVARTCHVGVALYDTSSDNFTHFADPGKIKAYAEMHLPVLMTRISDIVPYVERFHSGEVIDRSEEIGPALERIRSHYASYQEGIGRFIAHFDFEGYYRDAFRILEGVERG